MIKLLITLVTFLLLGLAVQGMHHHRRELESQRGKLIAQIETRRHSLWDQDPAITTASNPLALAAALKSHGITGDIGVVDLPAKKKGTHDSPGDLVPFAPVRRRH